MTTTYRFGNYKQFDRVIIHTSHLALGWNHFHPGSGINNLMLSDSMKNMSGTETTITEVIDKPFGCFYRLEAHPGFYYTDDFLRPVKKFDTNQQSKFLLDSSH